MDVLNETLSQRHPECLNTDQGVQFASRKFTGGSEATAVSISMDGNARALDNLFI